MSFAIRYFLQDFLDWLFHVIPREAKSHQLSTMNFRDQPHWSNMQQNRVWMLIVAGNPGGMGNMAKVFLDARSEGGGEREHVPARVRPLGVDNPRTSFQSTCSLIRPTCGEPT
jgi:hypothetical protein